MTRPDYSEYVAHFTSTTNVDSAAKISGMSPLERLAAILTDKKIVATPKHYGLGGASVAFTECPWPSLLAHANQYSSYGIGFIKAQLWSAGGQPAIYMRSETLHAIRDHVNKAAGQAVYPAIDETLGTFYTPIERESGWQLLGGKTVDTHIDYTHEREWRVPTDFSFEYEDVKFLIVEQFADIAKLPPAAVKVLGERSILSMSNYRRIEELWPTHRT